MRLIFDLESNGLLDTMDTIHCISICDLDQDGELYEFRPHQIDEAVKMLSRADELMGHNILTFDIPAIQLLYPEFKPKGKIMDTLVTARFMYPDIKGQDFDRFRNGTMPGKLIGRHSLEAWGYRLGVLKGEFGDTTDWVEFTEDMMTYCSRDVNVTYQLYDYLVNSWDGIPKEASQIEHQVTSIIDKQESYGFLFDVQKAEKLYIQLQAEREEVRETLADAGFTSFYKPGKEFIPKRDNARLHYTAGCAMTKIKLVDFNPDSRDHIIYWLKKKYNWIPEEFTDATNPKPKVSEKILEALPYPSAAPLVKNFMLSKRLGMLADGNEGWLKKVQKDGRLHGRVHTNGTCTGRMSHSNPNVGQVTSVDKPYGKECRELFCVPRGHKLVGVDASGLEGRCLSHFIIPFGGKEYADVVLGGDIHDLNRKLLGLPEGKHYRSMAKTWFYATMYGAGQKKVQVILKCSSREAKKKLDGFWAAVPSIKRLQDAILTANRNRGHIKGLDGRPLQIRSSHAALNTLLQSAGAVIMKKALCLLDDSFKAEGIPAHFVANIHDEFQIEVEEEYAERVKELGIKAIVDAGLYFKLNVPLDGDGNIGNNWKETH